MDSEYRLVQMYNAQHVEKVSLEMQATEMMQIKDVPWYRNGKRIGSYLPTSILKQVPGLEKIQNTVLNQKQLRQLAAGHIDSQGRDIGGYYVVSDIGAVWLFRDPKAAIKWAKQIDRSVAPSFTLIDSGQDNVGFVVIFVRITSTSEIEAKFRRLIFRMMIQKNIRVAAVEYNTIH